MATAQDLSTTGQPSFGFLANVKGVGYGAKGDGTTDDTTAIQAAATAVAAAGGGILLIPPGTFIVDNVSIGDNVHVVGAGMGATILKCTRATGSNYLGVIHNADQAAGNTDLSVRDLTIWRSVEVAGGAVFDEHLYFKKCTRLTFERLRLLGTIDEASHAGKGLHLDGCTQSLTRGCWFENLPDNAWAANPQTSWTDGYHSVLDNTFIRTSNTDANSQVLWTVHYVSVIGNRFKGPGAGSWIETGQNSPVVVPLRGCRITDNVVTGFGSLIGSLDGGVVRGNTVYNGSINTGSDAGANRGKDWVITGNTVVGGAITCNNSDGVLVANNTVDGTSTTNLSGIAVSGCSDYTIADNRVTNAERNGLHVLTGTAPGRITGNRAYNCATNATADDSGINLDNIGDGIIIEGNESIDDGSVQPHACYINVGTNLTLRNNVFSGAAGSVFRDDATSYRAREGNVISGVPEDGLATLPSGTGISVSRFGDTIALTYDYRAWQAAALTKDNTLLVTTAGTWIKRIVCRTTTAFVGTTTAVLRVGVTSGGQELIVDHDVKTAVIVVGDADADLGTSINRASAVQAGYVPASSGANLPATTVYGRMTSTVDNLSSLSAGSVTFYITVERIY